MLNYKKKLWIIQTSYFTSASLLLVYIEMKTVVEFHNVLGAIQWVFTAQWTFLEAVDENLRLGPKLTTYKKSTLLALSLWNLAIVAYSWGGHVDQVSQNY